MAAILIDGNKLRKEKYKETSAITSTAKRRAPRKPGYTNGDSLFDKVCDGLTFLEDLITVIDIRK